MADFRTTQEETGFRNVQRLPHLASNRGSNIHLISDGMGVPILFVYFNKLENVTYNIAMLPSIRPDLLQITRLRYNKFGHDALTCYHSLH